MSEMTDIEKDIENINNTSIAPVDWAKIKEILCGIAAALIVVCGLLPGGLIKNIVCGISGIINLICKQLPG